MSHKRGGTDVRVGGACHRYIRQNSVSFPIGLVTNGMAEDVLDWQYETRPLQTWGRWQQVHASIQRKCCKQEEDTCGALDV